jgi:long-chain fatty acid transport protein
MATRLGKTALSVLALVAAAGVAGRADAAGFQLFEQSPSGQGDAFAGAAAAAEDASTIFYNPAGMTYLKGPEAIAGVHIVWPEATFKPHTATTINGPLTGKRTPDGGEVAEIPNLYGSLPLDYGLTAGIGVSAPFGLVTDYGGTWIGRYHAQRTDLRTVDVNPSLAWKATDWLSIGGGFDVLRADAELTNAIDFGSICAVAADGLCGLFGLSPQANDGQVKFRASDTTTAYNAGVMLQPLEHTRIGLTYRSSYVLNFSGGAEFSVPTAFRSFQGFTHTSAAFTTTGARAKITLPETASAAVYQEITPKWAVLGDVTWTRWSRFKNLTVQFDNPAQPEQTVHEGWHNTFREAAGVLYSPNEKSKLRFGIAYDPTPVPTRNRTFRIPDDDRFWLSIGYNLHVWEGLSVDAAYTHIFVLRNAEVNATSTNPANPQGTVSGTYDAQVNIFAVGLKYQF